MEGPFTVVLHDGAAVGEGDGGDGAGRGGEDGGGPEGGGQVLAGVVAFGGAGPEEEAAVEGWEDGGLVGW